ncbi:MAG: lysophospholipid acyltransferase family protein [Sulfurospirillaceae bacterium]|nr:lysophospholipid acyltransferase family protein [Sulfurospirillaceae bacterium]
MSTKQRGSGWSINLVFNFYKLFGYTFVYYLMYPVTFFYFIVATNVKEALKDYYKHIDKPFNNLVYFHHLRHFAITMCDRFISKIHPQDYTFLIENEEKLLQTLNGGCILLLSHFGGWATAGNCFKDLKINIVMQEVIRDGIKRIEEKVPQTNDNLHIINLSKGTASVSLEIANALLNNEIIAMMSDRASEPKNNQAVDFFAQKANFNKNPFVIAYKTEKPLVSIAFVYEKSQCYRVKFTQITMNKESHQTGEIQNAMRANADFLANVVSQNPEQWFNLYHFWKEKQCA